MNCVAFQRKRALKCLHACDHCNRRVSRRFLTGAPWGANFDDFGCHSTRADPIAAGHMADT